MLCPLKAASALAVAVFVVCGLTVAPQNTAAQAAPIGVPAVSAGAAATTAFLPTVMPRKSVSQVRITGCTKSQKKKLVSYLKKWGRNSNINSITCKSHTATLGSTVMYFYPSGTATIVLRKSMHGKLFKQVAVHEIMHAVEAWDYGPEGALEWSTVRAELGHRFGYGSGPWGVLENAADCMTQRATGSRSYLHYMRHGCSASQRSAAAVLIGGHQL